MEGNAAFIAMAGPARALNTIGGQVTWQSTAFGAICAGLMSMFLVGRHTRAEEESGRDELLRAAAVGRHAPMTAAVARRDARQRARSACWSPPAWSPTRSRSPDSLALGVGLTLPAGSSPAVALVAAQLTASTRATYGLAGAVIGVAYVLRAIGDVGTPALSWLSPIGWYQAMHAFSGLRWWPAAAARWPRRWPRSSRRTPSSHRRDFGAGVLAARPGPGRAAARGLRSGRRPGLAAAARRVLGWAVGLLPRRPRPTARSATTSATWSATRELSRDMFAAGRRRPRGRLLRHR